MLKSKYEEELKHENEKNKMVALSELLTNIAHQWRQPLSAISAASFNFSYKNELLKRGFNFYLKEFC